MDEHLRRLEREAQRDPQARQRLARSRARLERRPQVMVLPGPLPVTGDPVPLGTSYMFMAHHGPITITDNSGNVLLRLPLGHRAIVTAGRRGQWVATPLPNGHTPTDSPPPPVTPQDMVEGGGGGG